MYAQRFQLSMENCPTEDCLYTKGLLHCAIGWVCLGYETPGETTTITYEFLRNLSTPKLQSNSKPERVQEEFHGFAKEYGLTIPK